VFPHDLTERESESRCGQRQRHREKQAVSENAHLLLHQKSAERRAQSANIVEIDPVLYRMTLRADGIRIQATASKRHRPAWSAVTMVTMISRQSSRSVQ